MKTFQKIGATAVAVTCFWTPAHAVLSSSVSTPPVTWESEIEDVFRGCDCFWTPAHAVLSSSVSTPSATVWYPEAEDAFYAWREKYKNNTASEWGFFSFAWTRPEEYMNWKAMMHACKQGNALVVRYVLDKFKNVSVNQADSHGGLAIVPFTWWALLRSANLDTVSVLHVGV